MLFTADALISCELHSPPQSMIAAMRKPVTSTILAQDAIAAPPNTKNAEAHLSYPDTSRERAPKTGEIGGNTDRGEQQPGIICGGSSS